MDQYVGANRQGVRIVLVRINRKVISTGACEYDLPDAPGGQQLCPVGATTQLYACPGRGQGDPVSVGNGQAVVVAQRIGVGDRRVDIEHHAVQGARAPVPDVAAVHNGGASHHQLGAIARGQRPAHDLASIEHR